MAKKSGWPNTSRHERGYDAKWERTRVLVLKRDCGLCQRCLRANLVQAGNECHHVKPKAECKRLGWTQAQTDSTDNLETLCHACHEEADAEAQGKTLRPKVQIGLDGYPTAQRGS